MMGNRILFSVCLSVIVPITAHAQKTVTYPAVPELVTSTDYTVSVNGRNVWVEEIGPGGMENLNVAGFSCEGRQDIVISVPDAVTSYTIQPESLNVRATASGRTLALSIDGPSKLYISINQKPYLAVFANPLEENAPSAKTKGIDYYGPGYHDAGRINVHDGQVIYIAGGADVKADIYGSAKDVRIFGRGSLDGKINLRNCENLTVDGIFIRNTRGWSNTITNSVNTLYNNVKVFSHTGVWGLDGINPVSCKGFTIRDCFIRTRDDCIAVKSNGNPEEYDLASRDILVENSTLVGWDHADGVTLGFELNGSVVENIRVRNCDILRSAGSGRSGGHSAFSIVCDGESEVRDIFFDDIRVEADMEYKNLEIILTEAERYGNGKMGSINGVYLNNIRWANAGRPLTIVGHPTRFVENVVFTNCYVGGKLLTGFDDAWFQVEYVRGIEFVPGVSTGVRRYPYEETGGRVPGQRRAVNK